MFPQSFSIADYSLNPDPKSEHLDPHPIRTPPIIRPPLLGRSPTQHPSTNHSPYTFPRLLLSRAQGETVRLRGKEGAVDYRFFPEPDLPPLVITDQKLAALEADMPELPEETMSRLPLEYGIADSVARWLVCAPGGAVGLCPNNATCSWCCCFVVFASREAILFPRGRVRVTSRGCVVLFLYNLARPNACGQTWSSGCPAEVMCTASGHA